MYFSQRRGKRTINPFSNLYAKVSKNLRCLIPRLKRRRKPKQTSYYEGRKKRDINDYGDYTNYYPHDQYTPYDDFHSYDYDHYESFHEDDDRVVTIEDCFDDVPKPRYGFR